MLKGTILWEIRTFTFHLSYLFVCSKDGGGLWFPINSWTVFFPCFSFWDNVFLFSLGGFSVSFFLSFFALLVLYVLHSLHCAFRSIPPVSLLSFSWYFNFSAISSYHLHRNLVFSVITSKHSFREPPSAIENYFVTCVESLTTISD